MRQFRHHHRSSRALKPILPENGASICPGRPRDGLDDEDGAGDRHRVLVAEFVHSDTTIVLPVSCYLYVPKMGLLYALEGLETDLMTKTEPVTDTTDLSDPAVCNFIFVFSSSRTFV